MLSLSLPSELKEKYLTEPYTLPITAKKEGQYIRAMEKVFQFAAAISLTLGTGHIFGWASRKITALGALSVAGMALHQILEAKKPSNDYYSQDSWALMREKALTSHIFQSILEHGSANTLLDEQILSVTEMRAKMAETPEYGIACKVTRFVRSFQKQFEEKTSTEILTDPKLVGQARALQWKLSALLEKTANKISALSIANLILKTDLWEKNHTQTKGTFPFTFKTLEIKNYRDPSSLKAMRHEALNSDLFALVKSHGSIQKVLDARILTYKEAKQKISEAHMLVDSLIPGATEASVGSWSNYISRTFLPHMGQETLYGMTDTAIDKLSHLSFDQAETIIAFQISREDLYRWGREHLVSSML